MECNCDIAQQSAHVFQTFTCNTSICVIHFGCQKQNTIVQLINNLYQKGAGSFVKDQLEER
jgi:myosin-crossreactive antigen